MAYNNYQYRAGTGGATITLPAVGPNPHPLDIMSITATATAPGATVQIDAGDLIPVPVGGSVAVDTQGGIHCDVTNTHTVTFVGTAAYLVDWLAL